MKIDDLKHPFINHDAQAAGESRSKAKAQPAAADPARTEENTQGDVVQLSDRAKMVARANELATGAPDVREEKINDLRRRIDAGTYNVSARHVAESMLRKSITEV